MYCNRQQTFRNILLIIPALSACCIFLVVCIAFILPLAAAISPLFSGNINTIENSRRSIFTVHIFRTAFFTLRIALGSTFIAALIGIPAAFFTANRTFPARRLLLSFSAVPLCIPSLIIALGYVSLFGMSGTVNRLLGHIFHTGYPSVTFLYSFRGIIIAQGFYNFPIVMSTVSSCWEHLPAQQADAARMLGAGELHVFRTITIFQIAPSVLSACIPVFLYSFFSFMIVLLFGNVGGSTLEVEIYQAARTTLDFHEAAGLALFETLCAVTVVTAGSFLEQRSLKSEGLSFDRKTSVRKYTIGHQPLREPVMSVTEYILAGILFFCIALFFLAPLIGIITAGFTGTDKKGPSITVLAKLLYSDSFRTAVRNTILTATATGILSTITAFVYACILRKKDSGGMSIVFRTVLLLPMAVSSIVTGFGMSLLVHRGSPAVLVIAQTALTWPLAFRQIYTVFVRLPRKAEDAARILSPNPLDTIYRIYLPFTKRGIFSAFCFCFAVSCGDTALPLVLAVPHFDTLSLYTYRLAGSYRFTQACACGTVLGILCASVFLCSEKLMNGNSNRIKDKKR